ANERAECGIGYGGGNDGDELPFFLEWAASPAEFSHDHVSGRLDTAPEAHRIRLPGKFLNALADHRVAEDDRGRGPVPDGVMLSSYDVANVTGAEAVTRVFGSEVLRDGFRVGSLPVATAVLVPKDAGPASGAEGPGYEAGHPADTAPRLKNLRGHGTVGR